MTFYFFVFLQKIIDTTMRYFFPLYIIAILFTNCSKQNPVNKKEVTTSQYYEYQFSDFFTRIEKKNYNNITTDIILTEQLHDSLYRTVRYNSLAKPYKKEYFYIDSTNKVYKSIDSVLDSFLIIAEYNYTYNEQEFLCNTSFTGTMRNLISEEIEYNVTGSVVYTIENENISNVQYERSFSGTKTYTEREIHTYTYTDTLNVMGVQGFMQPFCGKPNKHLLRTEIYELFKDNNLQEKGTFTYAYIMQDSLFSEEICVYTPFMNSEYRVRTHSLYQKNN